MKKISPLNEPKMLFPIPYCFSQPTEEAKKETDNLGTGSLCGLALLSHDEKRFLEEGEDTSITFRYLNSFLLVMICKYF